MATATTRHDDQELQREVELARQQGYDEGWAAALGIHGSVAAPFVREGSWAESILAQELLQLDLVHFAERDAQAAARNAEGAHDRLQRRTAELHEADEAAEGWRSRVRALVNPERQRAMEAGAEMRERESWAEREHRRVTHLRAQLEELRASVDAEITEDHPLYRARVAARRQASFSARFFGSVEEFIADDPRRELTNDLSDLAGYGPYGRNWKLEEIERPWFVTEYAIFWHPDTREVYARTFDDRAARQIWVLGQADTSELLDDALEGETWDRQRERIDERNSLSWAAEQIKSGRARQTA